MPEYSVYTDSSELLEVIEFVRRHDLIVEYHLNRIRITLDHDPVLTEFLMRFSTCARSIDS